MSKKALPFYRITNKKNENDFEDISQRRRTTSTHNWFLNSNGKIPDLKDHPVGGIRYVTSSWDQGNLIISQVGIRHQ